MFVLTLVTAAVFAFGSRLVDSDSAERVACAPKETTAAPRVEVAVERLSHDGVPYLEIVPANPTRTIILVHGGPEIPTLEEATPFDCHLARRYRARVIKPAYYGSSERLPWSNTLDLDLGEGVPKAKAGRRLLAAYRKAYGGMPQSVSEVRRFIKHWDGPSTVVIGESHGAMVAALSAQIPHRSRLVLVAPMLATTEEVVDGTLSGAYDATAPIEPPKVVVAGRDIAAEIFDTPERMRAAIRTISLAYYEPWQSTDLGTALKKVPGEVTVIVGLRDRTAMVTGEEWRRLQSNAPRRTAICLDADLGHDPPMTSPVAERCLEEAMGEVTGRDRAVASVDPGK